MRILFLRRSNRHGNRNLGAFMKLLSHALVVVVLLASAALLFGPRTPFDDDPQAVEAPPAEELDGWLAAREAEVPDLRPGAAKEIVWADPAAPARTPLAVVYVHGFSATKAEIRPVPDIVARELGANLHFARLTGHGRTSDAMGEATVGAWFDDVAEALAVGRRIGDRVLVIATSTGGTLAALFAADPEMSRDVAGIAFVSPNFGVQSVGSSLLTLPFARSFVPLVIGATGRRGADAGGGRSETALSRRRRLGPRAGSGVDHGLSGRGGLSHGGGGEGGGGVGPVVGDHARALHVLASGQGG